MATWDRENGRPRRRIGILLDALFGEAWEIQRRRRRRYLLAWLVLLGLAVGAGMGVGVAVRDGGHRADPARSVRGLAITHRVVTSEALPRSGDYGSLAVVGGRMLAWGSSTGDIAAEPLASAGTCVVSVVVPATLALTNTRHGSCADPRLFDERVLDDETDTRGGSTGLIEDVRVSVATGSGGYRVGPVLARYEQCSDCEDSFTYGDGSLWIYVPLPLGAPVGTGELLRISERTGAVAQRWRMPELIRALLASDVDGLWIAPSFFSGEPEHVLTAARRDYESLYRVAPGMRTPQRTHLIGLGGARWVVAAGSTVWVDSGAPTHSTITGLEGPNARTIFAGDAGAAECLTLGTSAIAGDATAGLDCLGGGEEGPGDSAVFSYSPRSGGLTARTPVHLLTSADQQVPAAVDDGAFYFLDPPNFTYQGRGQTATAQGAGVLYRVARR